MSCFGCLHGPDCRIDCQIAGLISRTEGSGLHILRVGLGLRFFRTGPHFFLQAASVPCLKGLDDTSMFSGGTQFFGSGSAGLGLNSSQRSSWRGIKAKISVRDHPA